MTVLFILIVAAVLMGVASLANPAKRYARLIARGAPARGILLRVAPQPTSTLGSPGQRYQIRTVEIDVELPGQPPYVTSAALCIPTNLVRDVLPGATVELRVHRRQPDQIAIVGPGVGFAGAAQLMAVAAASNANGGTR